MPVRRPSAPLPRLAIVAATILVVAACGSAASPSPSPSPDPAASPSPSPSATGSSAAASPSPGASTAVVGETGTVRIPDIGFTMTLADGWRVVPLDPTSIQDMGSLFPEGSSVAKVLQSEAGSLALAGIKLYAIDSTAAAKGDLPGSANLIVQDRPAGLSLELIGELAKAQLDGLDTASDVTVTPVTLPSGDALLASYTLEQQLADGTSITATGAQYYLVTADKLYILTFTGPEAAGAVDPRFATMAASVRLE